MIMPPKNGSLHCEEEELKCFGKKGSRWGGLGVCIEEKYKCDGIVQCEGGEDEMGCSRNATKNCEGTSVGTRVPSDGYIFNGHECDKFYKQLLGGVCGEKLKCIARDGRYVGIEICVPSDFICDNTLQCQGGEDEDNCEVKYIEKKIFSVDERVVCTSRSLNLTTIGNGTAGHFFPYRGGLSISLVSRRMTKKDQ